MYQKFVLITAPRCGNHMLRTALDNHPNIVCLPEMFNAKNRFSYSRDEKVSVILRDFIYKNYSPEVEAVGFLQQTVHCVEGNSRQWMEIWDQLASMEDLKVIYLSRVDLIARYVSLQRALKYNVWICRKDISTPRLFPPMVVNSEDLIADLRRIRGDFNRRRREFNHCESIDLVYEDLTDRYKQTMEKIQRFIGVEPLDLAPDTLKQEPRATTEIVKNYEDLKDCLRGGEWEYLFWDNFNKKLAVWGDKLKVNKASLDCLLL